MNKMDQLKIFINLYQSLNDNTLPPDNVIQEFQKFNDEQRKKLLVDPY